MTDIGVRELKARASEIIRAVRDRRERYVITLRGRPVGLLLPLEEPPQLPVPRSDVWNELIRLGEEIGREWRSPLTSAQLLSDMRR